MHNAEASMFLRASLYVAALLAVVILLAVNLPEVPSLDKSGFVSWVVKVQKNGE